MQGPNVGEQQHDRETRLRFMRIADGTGVALREFWPVVEPALPGILNGLYDHLLREPKLRGLIGSEQEQLKAAQSAHWARLFSGRFDAAYVQSARSIGLEHNRIGLEPRWFIGGYAFVLSHLTELAIGRYRWKRARLAEGDFRDQLRGHDRHGFCHFG